MKCVTAMNFNTVKPEKHLISSATHMHYRTPEREREREREREGARRDTGALDFENHVH